MVSTRVTVGGIVPSHGAAPGIADCAIWGYVQWLPEAGVSPTPAMAHWIARMRALAAMRAPADFFPPA
jgi:glutathione S-transferase